MELTPINVSLLFCDAHSLEMECDSLVKPSLRPHVESFLGGISLWTWYEVLEALKQCQEDLFPSKSNLEEIVDRIVDNLIERLASPSITSPSSYTCSSSRSSFQFSCDTSSNYSYRNNFTTWWFEHLLFLKIDLLDKVIRTMISHEFDHAIVSKFLFHYYNSSNFLGASQAEKIETTKSVINILSLLDMRSICCKDLFNLNRVAIRLKINRFCRSKIESLIGPLLDQVTIDYLLVPSPQGRDHAYDVHLVLRLLRVFLSEGSFELTLNKIKRVAKMMDLFLVEVAPDPYLKPSEFQALITVLPDTARESHDHLYLAMDMYLKVHAGLGEKEKMSICSTLKYEKLSKEILRHLTRSLQFPSEKKPRADVTTRQSGRIMKTLVQENEHLKNFFESMFPKRLKMKEDDVVKRICDAEVSTAIQKSGIHIMNNNNAMYLPKLCS